MGINLLTGEHRPPQPEDYCTKIAAVSAKHIDTPLFRAFLERITDCNVELQKYLQRAAGYWMTGSTEEHVLFFLYGTGANGKSVLINTLK